MTCSKGKIRYTMFMKEKDDHSGAANFRLVVWSTMNILKFSFLIEPEN